MIKSFANKHTSDLFFAGKSRRLCFRFERGDAYDVEVTDYH
jgi:plasmid maintenance system killer protein